LAFHYCTAVSENGYGCLVVPIVDDTLQNIEVTTGRDGVEEISGYKLTTGLKTSLGNKVSRTLNHRGLIEENATCLCIRTQDGSYKPAVSSADINDPRYA
jgi:hypothetical protein